MKKLTTASNTFGPYTTIEIMSDRYRCDGADLPFNIVGDGVISDVQSGDFPPTAADLERVRTAKKARLAEIANAKLSVGFTVNGLKISTDAEARGLLSLGKIGNKPSRKVVTSSGQRAILTAIQFSDVVAAADNYGQDIMNRWYDLDEALDNATVDTIDSIDINVGWPE